jgi:hypothetical protein
MAFRQRSRLKRQIDGISKLLGKPSRSTSAGVSQLLDSSVTEVKNTDENIKYFPVDSASPYILPLQELIAGRNIVGIRTAGAMTVRIPLRAQEEQVITVADERGTADVDPITIEVA